MKRIDKINYIPADYFHIVNRNDNGDIVQTFPGYEKRIYGNTNILDYPKRYWSYLNAVHDLKRVKQKWPNAIIVRPLIPCVCYETDEEDFKLDQDTFVK